MKASVYQEAIYDFIGNGGGNLLVQAVAGSGKTTTIVEAASMIDPKLKTLFVAFNKHIADELGRRLPSHVEARTLHSLGNGIVRKYYPGCRMKSNKVEMCLKYDVLDNEDFRDFRQCRSFILRMISLLKAHIITEPKDQDIHDLAAKFDIEIPDHHFPFELLLETYKKSLANTRVMDFDDMLFLPVYHDWAFPKYDIVFVDEAQDLNLLQMEMLARLKARVIAVGDRYQAIYGFRGADAAAMDTLKKRFNCEELPLSICYRCGSDIVKEAKLIVEQIQPAPDKETGEVRTVDKESYADLVSEQDWVLCRTTAPLVSECLRFIRNGTRAMIKGRDIGKQLKTLIKKVMWEFKDDPSLPNLLLALDIYEGNVCDKFVGEEHESKRQAVQDQCDTIRAVVEYVSDYSEVDPQIDKLFSDQERGVVFCTVHRSKGMETDSVFILRPDLIPHPAAKIPWQQEQEMNLKYVAITRAKKHLFWVEGK